MNFDEKYHDASHELLYKVDTHQRMVLRMLPSSYHTRILEQIQELKVEWGEDVVLRIGMTGCIKEGKVGKPNYQLQTISGSRKRAYRFNGELKNKSGYRESSLSPSLSEIVINVLWSDKFKQR